MKLYKVSALAAVAILAFAACSSTGASTAPSTGASEAPDAFPSGVSSSPPRATNTVWMVRDGWCREVRDGRREMVAEAMPYITRRRSDCNWSMAAPVSASRASHRSPPTRGPRASAEPRSNSDRGDGPPALRGTTRRRGIPGPSSPCHRYRPDRRPARRRWSDGRWQEPAHGRGPPPPARLPAAGQCRRRRDAATRRGRGGPRPSTVGHGRWVRRDHRPPGRRSRSRRRSRHRGPRRGAASIGQQQGLLHRGDGPAGRSDGADATGTPGLRRGRTPTTTKRDRGGSRRASPLMTVTPSCVIAPAGRNPRPKEYQ